MIGGVFFQKQHAPIASAQHKVILVQLHAVGTDNRLEHCVFLDSDCTLARGVCCTGAEVLLFFNPTDEEVRFSQKAAETIYRELWSGEEKESTGELTVTLPAHAARVYLRQYPVNPKLS